MTVFQLGSRVRVVRAVAIAASALLLAVPLDAQQRQENAFTWSGNIPSGRRILIKNINGSISVERSATGRVEVNATKEWRRGDPDVVRIEQRSLSNDEVVICAMWHEESRCEEDGIRTPRRNTRQGSRNNDVSVNFTVRVPEGVRVDLNTVNGALDVNGVTTEVIASTVNGAINARSAGGPVRARTVNGSIDVSMGSTGSANELDYRTVNGSIRIQLPASFGAQLELSTVNGRINTDFPVTISGSLSPRRLRGTVGDGSARFSASTVNGSITLRKN